MNRHSFIEGAISLCKSLQAERRLSEMKLVYEESWTRLSMKPERFSEEERGVGRWARWDRSWDTEGVRERADIEHVREKREDAEHVWEKGHRACQWNGCMRRLGRNRRWCPRFSEKERSWLSGREPEEKRGGGLRHRETEHVVSQRAESTERGRKWETPLPWSRLKGV